MDRTSKSIETARKHLRRAKEIIAATPDPVTKAEPHAAADREYFAKREARYKAYYRGFALDYPRHKNR